MKASVEIGEARGPEEAEDGKAGAADLEAELEVPNVRDMGDFKSLA